MTLAKTSQNKGRTVKDIAARMVGPVESLVSRVYDDVLHGACVIFVGAGSSTEKSDLRQTTFYDTIKTKSGFNEGSSPAPFPTVMQYFCDKVDGGRHNRLIREAIERIEYFCAEGEANDSATMFSRYIAGIPYLNRFVTTNWDPFLERALDVLVPMVDDRDIAFWDESKRQVLKIHGCITRPYSIVATQSDYDACMSRNVVIFNKLKDLMATKTFIFVGYSMRDADFQEVWSGITCALGHFTKLAYAVDTHATSEDQSFWKERGIELVKTSDIAFVRALRDKLVEEDMMPSDEYLDFLRRSRKEIVATHLSMGQETVGKLASAMYQDGLLHALDDILISSALGTKKKDDFDKDLLFASERLREMYRKRDAIEIAYWAGRWEIVSRCAKRVPTAIPRYFHPLRAFAVNKLVKGDKFSS